MNTVIQYKFARFIVSAMLAACLVLATACGDFLNETPKSSITAQNFYKTEADAVAATNAIYDYLISGLSDGLWDENFGGLFYNDYWEIPELMSDNAVSKLSAVDYQSLSNFEVDAYNSRVRILWRDFYQTINVCNTVITKVPPIPMDETLRNQLLAEARFVRGMCYFELVRLYGDVPLHTTATQSIDQANIERTPEAQVYEVILADLTFAEQHLKYQERVGYGRPFALSASALLARVYLTLGVKQANNTYLQLAIDKANAVIPAFPMGSFSDLFLLGNRFKGERIWEINFNATLSQGWKGNQFLVRLLPKMNADLGGPRNGQGFTAATEQLFASFEPGDTRRDVTLFKYFIYNDGSREDFDAPYFCKYWDRVAEPKGNESDATFPYLRTAEMYLIKAEALNEINQGPTAEAYDAINAVRTRAGLGAATAADYHSFKKAVLAERRAEFAIEGHRWHDLVRMCTLEEMQQLVQAAKPTATPKATHLRLPIPQREREVSHGRLSQNAGY